jgi:hypothetical protein
MTLSFCCLFFQSIKSCVLLMSLQIFISWSLFQLSSGILCINFRKLFIWHPYFLICLLIDDIFVSWIFWSIEFWWFWLMNNVENWLALLTELEMTAFGPFQCFLVNFTDFQSKQSKRGLKLLWRGLKLNSNPKKPLKILWSILTAKIIN